MVKDFIQLLVFPDGAFYRLFAHRGVDGAGRLPARSECRRGHDDDKEAGARQLEYFHMSWVHIRFHRRNLVVCVNTQLCIIPKFLKRPP